MRSGCRPLVHAEGNFQAADAPEPRVRKATRIPALAGARATVRGTVVAGREIGGVAQQRARVQPVVCADGDGHEAEGSEGAHRGQQHLHALLAAQAPFLVPAFQRLQLDCGQPGGRGPPPGKRRRGQAGGWGGTARAELRAGPGRADGAGRRRQRQRRRRGQRAAMAWGSVRGRSALRGTGEGCPAPPAGAPQKNPGAPGSRCSPSPSSEGPRRPAG